MSEENESIGGAIQKLLGTIVSGPKVVYQACLLASLSVARGLLTLSREGIVEDIDKMRDYLHRDFEADAQAKEAKSSIVVSKAMEAHNRATLHEREDVVARIEKQRLEVQLLTETAEADRSVAEVEKIRAEIQSNRDAAIAEALDNLEIAISVIKQQGGQVAIDPEQLQMLIDNPTVVSEDDIARLQALARPPADQVFRPTLDALVEELEDKSEG